MARRRGAGAARKALPAAVLESRPGLDLFLREVPPRSLPKRGSTLPPLDIRSRRRREQEVEELEQKLEETEAPLHKASIERLGLSFDEMRRFTKKRAGLSKVFEKQLRKEFIDYGAWELGEYEAAVPFFDFCKEFTVQVCRQKVCVDHPVPLAVDDIWLDYGSDGSFNRQSASTFHHDDEVHGRSSWNLTYHRHSRTHEGGILIRSSAELVESSKIRQVGIVFRPLVQPNGWPQVNGVFAMGDDPFLLPPSWGRGKMWSSFQVSTRTPGGTWVRRVPDSIAKIQYKDTGKIESRIAQVHTYPPDRRLDVQQTFPAGTQLLIEVRLEYWIRGRGAGGNAWADYNLEVLPYMNLEACSWQYPDWVCVPVPE